MVSRLISRDSGRPTSNPFWVHSRQHPSNIHSLLSCPYHIQIRVQPSHSEGRDSPRTGFLSSSKLIYDLFPLTLCIGLISSLCFMYPKSILFLCSFSLSINPIPSFKEAFFGPLPALLWVPLCSVLMKSTALVFTLHITFNSLWANLDVNTLSPWIMRPLRAGAHSLILPHSILRMSQVFTIWQNIISNLIARYKRLCQERGGK